VELEQRFENEAAALSEDGGIIFTYSLLPPCISRSGYVQAQWNKTTNQKVPR